MSLRQHRSNTDEQSASGNRQVALRPQTQRYDAEGFPTSDEDDGYYRGPRSADRRASPAVVRAQSRPAAAAYDRYDDDDDDDGRDHDVRRSARRQQMAARGEYRE